MTVTSSWLRCNVSSNLCFSEHSRIEEKWVTSIGGSGEKIIVLKFHALKCGPSQGDIWPLWRGPEYFPVAVSIVGYNHHGRSGEPRRVPAWACDRSHEHNKRQQLINILYRRPTMPLHLIMLVNPFILCHIWRKTLSSSLHHRLPILKCFYLPHPSVLTRDNWPSSGAASLVWSWLAFESEQAQMHMSSCYVLDYSVSLQHWELLGYPAINILNTKVQTKTEEELRDTGRNCDSVFLNDSCAYLAAYWILLPW